MTNGFQRYLTAKQPVDDRALDRRVLEELQTALTRRASTLDRELRVLEVGAGIGTMLTRALEWDLLPPGTVQYTAVDLNAENIDALVPHCRDWATDRAVSDIGTDPMVIERGEHCVEVTTAVADASQYAADHAGEFDLLVGAAFLDIFDLDGLGTLLGALSSGGLYYFPIIFDGATGFLPSHPDDNHVLERYHAHMDHKPGGASQAGQAVIERLQQFQGVALSAVAGSDWFVRPIGDTYPGDEAYFLSYILDTIEEAVGEMPDADPAVLSEWLDARRSQLDAADLSYLTHQLDACGRVTDAAALTRKR
jgi:SAM-dependent methyltransferase